MKVKILYIIDKLEIAGAQRHLVELVKNIDREKYQPAVCCLLYEGPLAQEIRGLGTEIINLRLRKLYGIKGIIGLFKLSRLIKNNNFDIVQTYLFSANIFGVLAAKLAGNKSIISCRRDTGMLREGKLRHILAYRLTNAWVDKIICVSNAVRRVVKQKEGICEDKLITIYNGVGIEKFEDGKSKIEDGRAKFEDGESKIEDRGSNIDFLFSPFALRNSLGIKEDEKVVGIIGSLSWIKGHQEFIGAASLVVKEVPNVKFLIVGDGPLKDSLKFQVRSLGLEDKVMFLGKRTDTHQLLSIMDVSVNASYSEGMSNTVLETMAAGVPIVATAIDGNLETINRQTGMLVPARNSLLLADAIIKLLRNKELAERLSLNAKNAVKEKFSTQIMVTNFQNLYQDLLKPRITYITSQFPETHETFILREIQALKQKGVHIKILSLKPCRDKVIHPEARELMTQTIYGRVNGKWLIVNSIRHPIRTVSSLLYVIKSYFRHPKELIKALYVWLECFYFLRVLEEENISHIHSHWATMPTTAAIILSRLTGIPFSFTAHAWDIFVNPDGLAEKIKQARFVVTCTDYNRKFLSHFSGDGQNKKIYLNYHGIDLEKFESPSHKVTTSPQLRILSIGRLVETKGFEYLIDACGILRDKGIAFECLIVGEGPLKNCLWSMVNSLWLKDKVKFLGTKTQEEIKKLYSEATILVQPSVMAKNGDRDGIPNVILEAMAVGVPVIATNFSGIPEAVTDQKTGVLVPEKDSIALGSAIENLWNNTPLREILAQNGRKLVEESFDVKKNVEELVGIFESNGILIDRFGRKSKIENRKSRERINVLYVIWSLELGGAERVVVNLVRNLDKSRFNPIVCCLNEKGELASELENIGIKVIALNKRGKFDICVIKNLICVIKQYKIDIVHTHLWGANFWGRIAARIASVKVSIATEHNIDSWKQWYNRLLDKMLFRFTDKIITVSEAVKEFYADKVGLSRDKIEVIYNGVDIDEIENRKSKIENRTSPFDLRNSMRIKKELGIYDGVPVITNIGRLVTAKAQVDFLDALEVLNDEGVNFKAIIVGDGPLKSSLKFKVKSLGLEDKVVFTGGRKDVINILAISDLLVLTSLREGLPLTIMEAMSVGVPVIATDVGGNKELIDHQNTGFLVEPRNTKTLSETIKKVLTDKKLASNIAKSAKNRVQDFFSVEKMIHKHEELYSKLFSIKKE